MQDTNDDSAQEAFSEAYNQIRIGIDQADSGECTPVDIDLIKQKAKAMWNEQRGVASQK